MKHLILAPHIDDEVLGCYSFLRENTFVHFFGVEDRSYASKEQRIDELKASSRAAGFQWAISNHTVNDFRLALLIGEIEARINELKPNIILFPGPCYNQDHRAVHSAAMVAVRPHDKNWFVPTVLLYEQPQLLTWPYGIQLWEPNYFRPIDIEAKLKLYSLYASQVRGHRSPELLRSQARLRGCSANHEYAEAFFCKRNVDSG